MGHKALFLPNRCLMNIVRPPRVDPGGRFLSISAVTGMPKDARIVSVHVDVMRRGIVLTIESDEFPPVPDGNMLEEMSVSCDVIATILMDRE